MIQPGSLIIALNGRETYPLITTETKYPLLIFDFEGKFLNINSLGQKLLGYTSKDIKYRFITDFVYSTDISKVLYGIRAMLRLGGRPLILRYLLRDSEGTLVPVRAEGRILYNAKKPYAVQFIITTLTQIGLNETLSQYKLQW
jgi:PAS domain S-box-containing protein